MGGQLQGQQSGGSLKESGQEMASNLTERAGEAWESTKQGAQQFASSMAERAGDVWQTTRQGASRMASNVASGTEEAWESFTGFLSRHPVSSLLFACSVGFLVASALECMRENNSAANRARPGQNW
jgi:hypothetical protein